MTKAIRFEHMKEAKNDMDKQMASSSSSSAAEASTTLRGVLENHRASELTVSGKPVVELTAALPPLESAKILWKNRVLGAPVWDEKHHKYCGIFDLRDLLSIVLLAHERQQKEQGGPDEIAATWFPKDMHYTTSYLAARNPFVAKYHDGTTLQDLCQALIQKGVHVIPLVDPETGRCVRIVSQSAVVKFLADHVPKHHPALEATLEHSKFPYKKTVLQAPDTAAAKDVFTLMDQHRLSGIAIVDSENGKLVGNTSASDIKTAIPLEDDEQEVGADMDMDILSYLAAVRQETITKNDRYPSAHVYENSTVGHAIRLLAKTGFHRVFVVDKEVKPIGVISVTDVVRFVVNNLEEEDEAQLKTEK